MVVDEGFLKGAVETLGVGVHLGRPGVCVPALDVVALEASSQAYLELTAVVGQQDLERLRQPREDLIPGRLGGTGGFAGDDQGTGEEAGWDR